MKIIIENYEVEINAKNTLIGHKNMNDEDTMHLLNLISIYADETNKRNKERNIDFDFLSAEQVSRQIYDTLKNKGLYEN